MGRRERAGGKRRPGEFECDSREGLADTGRRAGTGQGGLPGSRVVSLLAGKGARRRGQGRGEVGRRGRDEAKTNVMGSEWASPEFRKTTRIRVLFFDA